MRKFIKLTTTILSIAALSPLALAHDFWLAPTTFKSAPSSTVDISFMVGHKSDSGPWDLQWKRIASIRQFQHDGVSDMAASVKTNSYRGDGSATANLSTEGTVVVGFESFHSTSELEAKLFNKYAEDEGLALVTAYRVANGESEKNGTEIYSRKAKTILQVGDKFTDNAIKPIGQTLEIVPVTHPYKSIDNEKITLIVMFKGKPLRNALVHMSSLNDYSIDEQKTRTDNEGKAEFTLPKKGSWLFNTVWGVPLQGDDRADFETYFSSLSIGF